MSAVSSTVSSSLLLLPKFKRPSCVKLVLVCVTACRKCLAASSFWDDKSPLGRVGKLCCAGRNECTGDSSSNSPKEAERASSRLDGIFAQDPKNVRESEEQQELLLTKLKRGGESINTNHTLFFQKDSFHVNEMVSKAKTVRWLCLLLAQQRRRMLHKRRRSGETSLPVFITPVCETDRCLFLWIILPAHQRHTPANIRHSREQKS